MELHEYQVKLLLARFGVPSPPHLVVERGSNIDAAVSKFGSEPLCVRAQVHGRGRKEGGGERSGASPQEVTEAVNALLGTKIVTSASGPQGFSVSKVIVMSVPTIVKQFYLTISLTTDGDVELSVCQEGGKVFTERPFEGFFRPFQVNRMTSLLGIRGALADVFQKVIEGVLSAFFHFDALLIEIDSLALTEDGIFQALDARMCIDDYALYRQPEVFHMMDSSQVGSRISSPPCVCLDMEGEIGCMGNGSGLALATADLVSFFEGVPGKVVNIGSDVIEDKMVRGLRMLQKGRPKVILMNLFTGLADGEKIAKVIRREVAQIPMVVYLEGTNAAGGRLLLQHLEPLCIAPDTLNKAAQHAVGLANILRGRT